MELFLVQMTIFIQKVDNISLMLIVYQRHMNGTGNVVRTRYSKVTRVMRVHESMNREEFPGVLVPGLEQKQPGVGPTE